MFFCFFFWYFCLSFYLFISDFFFFLGGGGWRGATTHPNPYPPPNHPFSFSCVHPGNRSPSFQLQQVPVSIDCLLKEPMLSLKRSNGMLKHFLSLMEQHIIVLLIWSQGLFDQPKLTIATSITYLSCIHIQWCYHDFFESIASFL